MDGRSWLVTMSQSARKSQFALRPPDGPGVGRPDRLRTRMNGRIQTVQDSRHSERIEIADFRRTSCCAKENIGTNEQIVLLYQLKALGKGRWNQ